MNRASAAMLLMCLLASCGAPAESPEPATEGSPGHEEPVPAEAPPPAGVASIELLDPGAEPRRRLRLRVDEGHSHTLRMALGMSMQVTVDGHPHPTGQVPDSECDVLARLRTSDDGQVRRDWSVGELEVKGEGAAADHLREGHAPLVGHGGWEVLDARGRVVARHVDVLPSHSREARQRLQQVQSNLESATVPFPTEAVGVGAQWRAVRRVTTAYEYEQVAHYTVQEIADAGEVVLKVQTSLEAGPQELGAGAEGRLVAMRGQVAGRIRVAPNGHDTEGSLESEVRFETETADGNGQKVQLVTEVETRYAFGSVTPEPNEH